MAITDKTQGVWNTDEVYNKINQSDWPLPSSVGDPMEMWSWGISQMGSLGLNQAHDTEVSSPTQIGTDIDWTTPRGGPMGAGMGIFQAVKNDGTLWRCGWNYQGAMGQPHGDSLSSPAQIGADTNWKVCSGRLTGGAIKTDGTFWTWGRNDWGQLGQNNKTPYNSPKQVGTESTWNNVNMEGLCNFATKTDGTLWAWGVNEQGSLGLNQAHGTRSSSPVQVGTDTTWEAVSTNNSEASAGLKTDGTLWVWGINSNGRLGLNTPNNSYLSSPAQVPGTTWADAVTMTNRTIALKTDGTIWIWGSNATGQLGLNDLTKRSSPTQIPGTTWTSVGQSGGGCAGVKDGYLYVWGDNGSGSLGLNSPSNDDRSSPTQVGTSTKWKSLSRSYHTSYIACKSPE